MILPFQLQECTTVFVCGPVASGKSFLVRELLRSKPRVTVLDTVDEYSGDETYEHIYWSPQALSARYKESPYFFRVAYHVSPDMAQDFYWNFQLIWQLDQPRWFVVEEVQEFCPNTTEGLSREMRCVNLYARKRKLGFVGVSQRFAQVSKQFIDNCRMVVIFRTEEVNQLNAIAGCYGKEVAEQVRNLRRLIYHDDTGELEQTPECLVKIQGKPAVIFSLGANESPNPNPNEVSGDTETEIDQPSENSISEEPPSIPNG